ncbi:hypothetical protein O181_124173 [Austropuccinia psidii MF-1]|uniref:Uncharacterized protein n=1 Tax=Austropuccinia psidii MF-1 TaxID=1389203 RepID=A0A9Q3KMI9_9BASI|nr:hypothetical protein [Austropuccinia psidii MF-1]
MPRTSQRHQALKDLELMWMISKIDENHQPIAKYLGLPTLPTLGSAMYPQDQAQSTLINQYVCQNCAYMVFWYLAFDWWMNWIMEVNHASDEQAHELSKSVTHYWVHEL